MKRDMDLVRKILLIAEDSPEWDIDNFEIDSFSKDQIAYHILLLKDAGLVEGYLRQSDNAGILGYGISRLTWAGHDFLDASRDEGRWNQAKEIFSKMGGVTFDVAKEVLVRLMMMGVSQVLPNPPIH
jgi:hypothetical protein